MKKLLITSILLAISTNAFAMTLIDDNYEEEKIEKAPRIVRHAYVMNRLNDSYQRFDVREQCDYLNIITNLKNGNLITTGDEQLNFNLLQNISQYSASSNVCKMQLRPMKFAELTAHEQKKYEGIKNFYIYAVEESYTANPISNQRQPWENSMLEDTQYVTSMVTQAYNIYQNRKYR